MELSVEQRAVCDALKKRGHACLFGEAGTGKSATVAHIEGDKVYLATTGAAAQRLPCGKVNGAIVKPVTVRSFVARMASKSCRLRAHLLTAPVRVIIDEVSMLTEGDLRQLETLCITLPYMSVLFLGDLHQLEPVKSRFFFETSAWNRYYEPGMRYFFLTKNFRSHDDDYTKVLSDIRAFKWNADVATFLHSRGLCRFAHDDRTIFTKRYRKSVDEENDRQAKLDTSEHIILRGPNKERLRCYAGMPVKLSRNIYVSGNLVAANGTTAVFISARKLVKVEKDNERPGAGDESGTVALGSEILLRVNGKPLQVGLMLRMDGRKGRFQDYEIPFRHTWADTIYGLQGRTLEDTERISIDFNGIRTYAELYTILSRARRPNQIAITGYNADRAKSIIETGLRPNVARFLAK